MEPSNEDIQKQQVALEIQRQILAGYFQQVSSELSTRAIIAENITQAQNEIRHIKKILRSWGVIVENLPDDEKLLEMPIGENTLLLVEDSFSTIPSIEKLGDVIKGDKFDGDKVQGNKYTYYEILIPRLPDHNRRAMLEKVNLIWIDGFLNRSLAHELRIALHLEERFDVVLNPLIEQVQELNRPSVKLPPETQIIDVFSQLGRGGALLMLGAPGAGKTTLLLELARDLISRAKEDSSHPIPVIINLSSWAKKQQPLSAWLIEELNLKYDVPQKIARGWIETDVLLPLLDGLDEVHQEQRQICVETINRYRQEHGLVSMVVCSRTSEYDLLSTKLRLQKAVVVQPLTSEQIARYFDAIGEPVSHLRTILDKDAALRELGTNPLMLSIMSLAYDEELVDILSDRVPIRERRRRIFAAYDRRMFERHQESRYGVERTRRWLTWLAREMENHSEYQFLIEQLQPSWLPNKRSQWHYEILDRLGAALFSSLVLVFGYLIVIIVYSTYSRYPSLYFHNLASDTVNFGILGILLGGLFGGFSPVIRFRQRSIWRLALNIIISAVGGGLVVGIVGRLISGRLGGGAVFGLAGAAAGTLAQGPALHLRRINVVETIRWSKERVLKLMPGFVVMGFIAGLLTGLLVNQLDGTLSSLFSPLVGAVVTGILMGVLLAVLFGLTHPELKARARPNEGIWRSARNAGWSGIEGAIIGVIFSLLTTAGPVTWLLLGLIGFLIGVLTNGGYACISHIALRYTLYRYDVLPWDCASFLDEAVQRVFLSRGGGRYVFIHRRLRRYFAELNHEGFPPLVNNRQSPKQQTTSFAMNLVVAAIFLSLIGGAYFFHISTKVPIVYLEKVNLQLDANSIGYTGKVDYPNLIKRGATIFVKAGGSMSIGAFSDLIGPEGVERDALGLPLGDVSKIEGGQAFPTGALLCKLSTEHEWKYCGVSLKFPALIDGTLQFQVNDKGSRVHTGHFDILVNLE